MNASLAQVKLLRLLKRKLGLSEEEYKEKTKCDDVGNVELKTAQKTIEIWKYKAMYMGVWENRKPKLKYNNISSGNRANFATPQQLRKIDVLWREISKAHSESDRNAGLKTFLQRRFKILSMENIQRTQAMKVIVTLTAMAREKQERESKQPAFDICKVPNP